MINCGHCNSSHATIAEVRLCSYAKHQPQAILTTTVDTAKVRDLISVGASGGRIASELREWAPEEDHAAPEDRFAGIGQPQPEERRANRYDSKCVKCQGWIESEQGWLVKVDGKYAAEHRGTCPAKPAASDEPTEFGMYRQARTGDLFRVYPAREGGHLLSKRLILSERPDGEATFMYAGAAKRNVKASEKMSLEEAKAFGQQFGICCCCAAILTDPTSVAAGIGPVCAGKV